MAKKTFYLIVTIFLTALNGTVIAAPEGGNIVDGSGSIDKQGNKTTVTQNSQNLVVDWDSFNVGKTEHVHFEQQNTTDSALNRIYDSRPSEIWGQLTGKGNIWLLNPNGVIFSKTAKVSTGGLVAAGLWMDSQDFMSGRYVLSNSRGTGDVSNAGVMEAKNIGLAGANIDNSGTIRAKAGKVSLASGERITVDFAGDGLMQFVTDSIPEGTSIDHSGSIEAGEVSISIGTANDIYGGVINTTGVIRATGANDAGGAIDLVAAEINQQGGSINADGTTGGTVAISADSSVVLAGSISARGTGGISTEQSGGSIRATADRTEVTATASIDASGETGGGEVLLGGGWQGNDDSIRNAQNTEVQQGATIKANANSTGDGGTIVVWSDNTTTFYGDIEARGGELSGDGGAAEVSGKEHLLMRGTADLRAPNGNTGKLLLDPGTVRICDGAAAGCTASGMDTFTDDGIQTMLGSANVEIATSNASSGDEDINIDSGVSIIWSANTLSLNAGNNINLNGSTLDAGADGTLALTFGNMLSLGSATLSGTITATGDGSSTLVGPGNTGDHTSWSIHGNNVFVGSVSITLTDVNKLQGGAGTDTFNVGEYTGSIDSGGGADNFNFGSGANVVGNIYGGEGSDTFNFRRRALVNIDGAIYGGAGEDTFNFWNGSRVTIGNEDITGTIYGEAGEDVFTFYQSAIVSGVIDGGAEADRLSYASIDGASVVLSGTPDSTGFSGSARGATFAGVDMITTAGPEEESSLVGLNADSTWTLDSSGYRISSGGQTLRFSRFGYLEGGSGADTFNINSAHYGIIRGGGGADVFNIGASGSAGVSIGGGAGTDTLSYASRSTAVKVGVRTGADMDGFSGIATDAGIFGFTGIDVVTADTATDNIFIGNIDGMLSGNIYTAGAYTLMVNGFKTMDTAMVVGTDVDTTWVITGNTVVERLADGTERTFVNVSSVQGGSMIDRFEVTEDTDPWILLALKGGGGNDMFVLDAILHGQIVGEAGADTVVFNSGGGIAAVGGIRGIGGNVNGGSGLDVFDFNGGTVAGSVVGGADSARLDFSSIDRALNIIMSGIPGTDGFSGNVRGGARVSSFSGVNDITGSSGMDTLFGSDNADAIWVLGTTSGRYSVASEDLTFSSLENIFGGRLNNSFTVTASRTGNLDGNAGDDRFNIRPGVSVSGDIYGGAGDDRFYFNTGASVSGFVSGGTDNDIFSFSRVSDALQVELSNANYRGFSGSVSGGATVRFSDADEIRGGVSRRTTDTLRGLQNLAGDWILGASDSYSVPVGRSSITLKFSYLETLHGGSMVDTFTVNGTHSGNIMGGGGDDIFNMDAGGSIVGTIDGGDGADTLSYFARTSMVEVTVDAVPVAAGFAGSATGTGGFAGIDTITAGMGGSDIFRGAIDGSLSGSTYTAGGFSLSVNGFEDLRYHDD